MQLGMLGHLLVLTALVVNLWIGGDLLQAWLGMPARHVAELALILGYMRLVLGFRIPLRRRHADDGSDDASRR